MPYTHHMMFRKFSGKTFKFFDLQARKRDAQAEAEKLRKTGASARVAYIKGHGYAIYQRRGIDS